ncbi:hypothetical protein V8B97DRAFT_1640230 [Scleroderma yunnanense]
MAGYPSNNPYQKWASPPSQSQYPTPPQPSYAAPAGPPPGSSGQYGYTQQFPQGTPQGYQPPSGGYPQDEKASGGHVPYQPNSPDPSEHERGPSPHGEHASSAGPKNGNSGLSLASFFGNKGPPPSWQRPPAPHVAYNQFPPMCLISNGKDLAKGFPELPPPCQLAPHPFSTHDVNEEDWKRFLADVKKGGSLTPGQRIKSNVIPLITGASFVGGLFMTFAIEKRMKARNRTAAGDVVDHWNHYFFNPRRMEAVLCQASERLSGREGPAPVGDPNQRHLANGLRHRSRSSSSSSSDSEDDRHGSRSHGHGYNNYNNDLRAQRRARKAERREARAERRDERRARKAERRERKARGEHQEPYQIFIQPIQ